MRRRIDIEETVVIRRPADVVWAEVEDDGNDRHWRAGLVEMTPTPPGPPRPGTTVHEVVRKAGSTYVTRSTVTGVGPGRCYRFEGDGDAGAIRGGRRVVTVDEGSASFTYDIHLELRGFNAIVAPVVRRVIAAGLRADLDRLVDRLERPDADAVADRRPATSR